MNEVGCELGVRATSGQRGGKGRLSWAAGTRLSKERRSEMSVVAPEVGEKG